MNVVSADCSQWKCFEHAPPFEFFFYLLFLFSTCTRIPRRENFKHITSRVCHQQPRYRCEIGHGPCWVSFLKSASHYAPPRPPRNTVPIGFLTRREWDSSVWLWTLNNWNGHPIWILYWYMIKFLEIQLSVQWVVCGRLLISPVFLQTFDGLKGILRW